MKPLPAFGERTGSGPRAVRLGNCSRISGTSRASSASCCGPEARPAGANRIGTQPLRHGRIGHLPLSGVTAAARRRMSLATQDSIELVGEPRLADPRFARDHGHSRTVLHRRFHADCQAAAIPRCGQPVRATFCSWRGRLSAGDPGCGSPELCGSAFRIRSNSSSVAGPGSTPISRRSTRMHW